jgi:predicted SnoaL-like aldol condensation-catalyzing enzyme
VHGALGEIGRAPLFLASDNSSFVTGIDSSLMAAERNLIKREKTMNNSNAKNNKAVVLEAFHTLFNKRDYTAAERFWSPNYIQHSAHIEPGRDGLFNLVKAAPPSLKYEPGVILAEDDYVTVHGRFSNIGLPVNWIAADIVRLKMGFSSNTGMSFRTRLQSTNPRAGIRCSAIRSRSNMS